MFVFWCEGIDTARDETRVWPHAEGADTDYDAWEARSGDDPLL
jgi:hypothetical protein